MREKLDVAGLAKSQKLSQHQEFLENVRKLDDLEQQKKFYNRKALYEDFKGANDKIIQQKAALRELQSRQKRSDRYSHFPFVGEETVHKHREKITEQLRTELEGYMDHKQQEIRSKTRGPASSNQDARSQVSAAASEAYVRSQRRTVKNLYDSAYIKPEDNFRVIQDNNPVKSATINEALLRYEQDIKLKNQLHHIHLAQLGAKVQHDEEEAQRERQMARRK